MDEDGRSEGIDQFAVRRAVQEVITTQVVLRDRSERDRLLDECIELHGEDIVTCITAFVYRHAAAEVVRDVAIDRFYYLLTRLSDLIELVADVEGLDQHMVLCELVGEEWQFSDDPAESGSNEALKAVEAMRAVQVCLVANHFVRRGSAPWGIQRSLDLDEMCLAVAMMGRMLFRVMEMFEEQNHRQAARALLADVEKILSALAHFRNMPVSRLVSEYFVQLALDEC